MSTCYSLLPLTLWSASRLSASGGFFAGVADGTGVVGGGWPVVARGFGGPTMGAGAGRATGVGRQGVTSGGSSMGGVGSACAATGDGSGDCVGVSRG